MRTLALLAFAALIASAPGAEAGGRPVPPQTPLNLAFGQVFDSQVRSAADLRGAVAFVWSDNHRFGPLPDVQMGQYAPAYRSNAQPLAWFVANHPTWVMYRADGATPAWEFGNKAFIPLDIANPDVVAFLESGFDEASLGRPWLDLDNIDAKNGYGAVGHYDSAGAFRARYTGKPGDKAWMADNRAYLAQVTAWAHARGRRVMINDSPNSAYISPADWTALASAADGVLIEGFPLHGCADDPPNWQSGYVAGAQFDRELGELIGQHHRPTFMVSYLCGHAVADATPREIAWISAARLLEAGGGLSLLAAGGAPPLRDIHGIEPYGAAWKPDIGPTCGPSPRPGSRPYVRKCARGVVALNPTTTTETVDLPQGADQFGNAISAGRYTLAPLSAVVDVTP